MSLTHRNKAKEVIAKALDTINGDQPGHITSANYILNQLLKAGYTHEKINVTTEEFEEVYGPSVTSVFHSSVSDENNE